jgi:hypothetical protein
MLEDYPNLTPGQLKSIKNYRHALREFININKENILSNGKTPDFPPQPEFININIIY